MPKKGTKLGTKYILQPLTVEGKGIKGKGGKMVREEEYKEEEEEVIGDQS